MFKTFCRRFASGKFLAALAVVLLVPLLAWQSAALAKSAKPVKPDLLKDHSIMAFKKKYNIATDGAVTKIILDADIMYMNDDTYALFELLQADACNLIKLLGITSAGGNALVASTTYDALATLDRFDRRSEGIFNSDIGVYVGTDVPLAGFKDPASFRWMIGFMPYMGAYMHLDKYTTDYTKAKELGLSYTKFPAPVSEPRPISAVDFIIDSVHKYPGEVTIMAIGGLTNIAQALAKDPTIVEDAAGIVYMGGVFDVPGEKLPNVEINWWYDPKATDIVLNAGWKKQIVVPHDAAVTCLKGEDVYRRFVRRKNVSPFARAIVDYLAPIYEAGKTEALLYCWDPITPAILLCPDLIVEQEDRDIGICTQEGIAYGSCFAYDKYDGPERTATCRVVFKVDRDRFWDFYTDLISVDPPRG